MIAPHGPSHEATPTDAADARATAHALTAALRTNAPDLLTLDGIDLGPALEQQLFFALRDGAPPPGGVFMRLRDAALAAGRGLGAAGAGLRPRRSIDIPPRPIVVLIRLPARWHILGPIEAALRAGPAESERAEGLATRGEPLVVLRVGRAADAATPHPRAPGLQDVLESSVGLRALVHLARVERRIGAATRDWTTIVDPAMGQRLRALARRELPRIALAAAALDAVTRRWAPRLLVSFDEVGTWSRIVPAVARRHAVPTLNLPHAVATLSAATAGADYDRFAVFGSRSADVLRAAGIADDRIVVTGAPYFDELAVSSAVSPGPERRIVFAAQYIQGSITADRFEHYYLAAAAAAEAVAPSALVVLPHPVQPVGLIEAVAARHPVPAGVRRRFATPGTLHAELAGAFALVTGSSNSVFEAALAGVPSILVDPRDTDPGTFAADGLGIGVADVGAAAAAARSLLAPTFRLEILDRARTALRAYLGPIDGQASARTARLILELAATPQAGGPRR